MNQYMKDAGDLRSYYSQIPHLADEELDPYEMRLYVHYKRVCGQGGECMETTETTATKTKMKSRKVQLTRQALAEKGWLRLEKRGTRGKERIYVTLVDRWNDNYKHFNNEATSTHAPHAPLHHMHPVPLHHMHSTPAPHAPKRRTIEEKPIKKNNGVAVAPPAPSIALSVENVSTPDNTPQSEAVHNTHSGSRSRLTPAPDSAPPPPPSKKRARKTNPELFNHPFVSVWRDVFRLNLPEAKMVQLSRIAVTPTALTQWRAACEAWVLRPYDPTNIGGILDWYHDPTRYQSRPSNGRGNYRTPTPPPVSPYTAMSEADKAAYLASCEPMED